MPVATSSTFSWAGRQAVGIAVLGVDLLWIILPTGVLAVVLGVGLVVLGADSLPVGTRLRTCLCNRCNVQPLDRLGSERCDPQCR